MNIFMRICLIFSLICSQIFFSSQTAFAFTIGEEREMGEKLFYTVRPSFKVLDDPDIQQYITRLGREVIDAAGVQYFDYHFFIIDNKNFNAFAAPSGLIFFYTGLIETMDSENEFVSVLAHEVAHIAKRHIASKIQKSKKVSMATMGLILASLALGGGTASQALFAGSVAAGQSANLHFSRLDEEEADLLAYGWMKELQRNPEGQESMLQTMRQVARYQTAKIPQYLLTHPNPESRLDYIQTLIETEKSTGQNYPENDNFDFLRFKFRILALTKETTFLRSYFSSILASGKSTEHQVIMAKYGLAQLNRVENNYIDSLQLLDEVIAYYPHKNILRVDKGLVEYESGEGAKALATLLTAYKTNRKDMYAAFALAKVSSQMGMAAKAEDLYTTIMYEMPQYPQVYFELGRLSAEKGKKDESYYYLGKHYLYLGKLKQSQQNLKSAVDGTIPEELKLDAKRSLDLIERLEE